MKIAIGAETDPAEPRVAATPETVKKMIGLGAEVAIEPGAGIGSGILDADYEAAGAAVAKDAVSGADIVLRVRRPDPASLKGCKPGALVIAIMDPYGNEAALKALADVRVTAFAMELMPRITRAQSMDALSSQATVSGYKAVLLAADAVPKMFPLLMTAAGTVAPARALVLGAGVAGLQAIATARRLGAVVSAFDVRPAVREQVESLGATFLDLGVTGEETEGGYAKELTPEQQAAQQAALEERIPEFDVVVTTALVPGRPAPRLIPAGAVERMRPGSAIVDLAAETGGNCELTKPGEAHGVTVIGLTNLPSLLPSDASRLYARNVQALLELLAPGGELQLDWEDEIVSGACVAGLPEPRQAQPPAASAETEEAAE
jgi:NAD(P) transhydrogenase subunit alpha